MKETSTVKLSTSPSTVESTKPSGKKNIWGLDRPLRILNYPWHLAHQHELLKLPDIEWSWLIQDRRPYSTGP